MHYKIIIEENISLQDLQKQIEQGKRFVVFRYCFSLIKITVNRFSKAYLIDKNTNIRKLKRKYDLVTIFFGWWGIPYGPTNSLRALRTNNSGGIDVTGDIMLNIDEDALEKREVEVDETNELFCKPNSSDIKAFRKAILKGFGEDFNVKKIGVALYINTKSPYYVVGFKVARDYNSYPEKAKKFLYKEFYRSSTFEFTNLEEPGDENLLFEQQCEFIINKG